MSENNKQNGKNGGSVWGGIAVIAIVVLIVGAILAAVSYFGREEVEDVPLDRETEQQLVVIQRYVAFVKPELSEDQKDDLQTVWDYIREDPRVLELAYEEHPADVRKAYERLQAELDYVYGSGERPTTDVKKGDEYTVRGKLEKAEQKSPTGQVYKVKDKTTGADLYFIFSKEQNTQIEKQEMVGKEVQIGIEITEVDSKGVAYKVTSGPTVVTAQ